MFSRVCLPCEVFYSKRIKCLFDTFQAKNPDGAFNPDRSYREKDNFVR
jgi:hypothetical protein